MKKTLLLLITLLQVLIAFSQKTKIDSLLKIERQKQIQAYLKTNSVYDSATEVSYIFKPLPKSLDTLSIAAKNNIFFAIPNTLNIMIDNPQQLQLLKKYSYEPKQIGIDVYQIKTKGNEFEIKKRIQGLTGSGKVSIAYIGYTNSCTSFNDPQHTNLSGTSPLHVSDAPWVDNGFLDPITHDLDSVYNWKYMHMNSTPSSPVVVTNIFDLGLDESNPEFQGRVMWKWNFTNKSSTISAGEHGTAVTYLAAATANNNYGGVGMYDGPIRMYHLGTGPTFNTAFLYQAIDSLRDHAMANPNQKQICNFSFKAGNDPILKSKIEFLYNLNNRKQCFFQAASGNSGSNAVDFPAAWAECTGWGATDAQDPGKTIWSGSNKGIVLDFVADGFNIGVMNVDGSFYQHLGTSLSTPLGTGTVANLLAQDTSRSNDDIRQLLREGAKDLGAPGWDSTYGWGWARTGYTLAQACVRHMPGNFNLNDSYDFTPKYYNVSSLTNRKCFYPNGTLAPVTIANGIATFNLALSAANGFAAGENTIKYQFTTPNGCVTDIYKTFILTNASICPGGNAMFYAETQSNFTYQWQADDGNGYVNISDNSTSNGANTSALTLVAPPTNWYGRKYRCLINGSTYSSEYTLKFSISWLGNSGSDWHIASNWSCGTLPDEFTDVTISAGYTNYPTVSADANCRSITVEPNATIHVNNGVNLNIKGKSGN